jgi:hypothetical protein
MGSRLNLTPTQMMEARDQMMGGGSTRGTRPEVVHRKKSLDVITAIEKKKIIN